jgi:hypothetical protein
MRKYVVLVSVLCFAGASWARGGVNGLWATVGQPQDPGQYQNQGQDQGQDAGYEPFSAEQLDNLLSPIALYPDPLLAQVLVAATFPDQVEEAARWVRGNGQNGVDDQNWDVSVRAVAHYPTVIEMMADRIDWTTSLGQAYVNQSTDVAESVQRLRHLARNAGNLESTPQQQVLVNGDYIAIAPNQPQYIYVPVYDPAICYYRRPYYGPAITFGAAFPIGAWLNLDFRWGYGGGYGGVYYTGWRPDRWGRECWNCGWINRSRGFVNVRNNVYINNRYTNVTVNRTVINRPVNVNNISRYNYVHKNVNYNNVQANNARRNERFNGGRGNGNGRPGQGPGPGNSPGNGNNGGNNRPGVNNKIIDRNINSNRVDQFRGRENNRNDRPPQAQGGRPENPRENGAGQQGRPGQQPNQPGRPAAEPEHRLAQPDRPGQQGRPGNREQTRPAQQTRQQPQARPEPQARPQPQARPEGPHGFGRSEGNFDPRQSGQRGQASRQQATRPAPPAARPTPAPRAAPAARPAPQARPAPAPRPQQSKPAPAPHGGDRRKP